MAKIQLSDSSHMYKCVIDTEAMEVELTEVFLGVQFVTENGERLAVSMRDSGFEVHYWADYGEVGFDAGWIEFKDGHVKVDKGGTVD